MRAHLTYANVMATIAVFIALGGSSYAAIKITGRNVPRDALTGADITKLTGKDVTNNSLTGADVKDLKSGDVADRSLLAEDFATGQLPQGGKGDKGDKGDPATKLFATVNTSAIDATLVHGAGVTGVTHQFEGVTRITFSQDVSPNKCATVATVGIVADGSTVNAFPVSAAAGNVVDVYTYANNSTLVDGADFNIAVFC